MDCIKTESFFISESKILDEIAEFIKTACPCH